MSKLQPKTKTYLRLGILFTILTILILGGLRAWQPNKPYASSAKDAIEIILFFSLIPGGFFVLALGEHFGKRLLKIVGALMILAEIIFIFI